MVYNVYPSCTQVYPKNWMVFYWFITNDESYCFVFSSMSIIIMVHFKKSYFCPRVTRRLYNRQHGRPAETGRFSGSGSDHICHLRGLPGLRCGRTRGRLRSVLICQPFSLCDISLCSVYLVLFRSLLELWDVLFFPSGHIPAEKTIEIVMISITNNTINQSLYTMKTITNFFYGVCFGSLVPICHIKKSHCRHWIH